MTLNKLVWEDKYSVGVRQIDDQHKMMFVTINQLVDLLSSPTKEGVGKILTRLVEYKKFHFTTEEKYFDEFNYELTEDHKARHKSFTVKLEELTAKHGSDSVALAYELVDFLEDWLIDHLMIQDKKYVNCFKEHGLT